MDRRGFLKLFGAASAAAAAAPLIPFNRVWSFPKKIVIPGLSLAQMRDRFLQPAMDQLFNDVDFSLLPGKFEVGDVIRIAIPQRFIIRDYIGDFSQPDWWREFTVTGVNKISQTVQLVGRR